MLLWDLQDCKSARRDILCVTQRFPGLISSLSCIEIEMD